MSDLITEVRELRKAVAGLQQARLRTLMPGTVKAVKGSRVEVTLADDGDDGPVETPELRLINTTGKRGGGVSKFTKLGVGDPVLVVSPDGDVTTASGVMPWVDSEDDPAPGAAETDGDVTECGNAKIEVKDGMIRLTVGASVITMSAGGITINGQSIAATGASLTHNTRNIGSSHTHGGITPGGARTDIPG